MSLVIAESPGASLVEDVDKLTTGPISDRSHALSVEGMIWQGLVVLSESSDVLSETLTVVVEDILALNQVSFYVILVLKYHQDLFRKDRRQLKLEVK